MNKTASIVMYSLLLLSIVPESKHESGLRKHFYSQSLCFFSWMTFSVYPKRMPLRQALKILLNLSKQLIYLQEILNKVQLNRISNLGVLNKRNHINVKSFGVAFSTCSFIWKRFFCFVVGNSNMLLVILMQNVFCLDSALTVFFSKF